jgi:hypothetical protein
MWGEAAARWAALHGHAWRVLWRRFGRRELDCPALGSRINGTAEPAGPFSLMKYEFPKEALAGYCRRGVMTFTSVYIPMYSLFWQIA